MITGISHLEMRSRHFDESREIYGTHLGLTEIQNTTAVLNEKGEWESTTSETSCNREAIFQVGDSFLIIHEDLEAPTELSADGADPQESRAVLLHTGHSLWKETIMHILTGKTSLMFTDSQLPQMDHQFNQ